MKHCFSTEDLLKKNDLLIDLPVKLSILCSHFLSFPISPYLTFGQLTFIDEATWEIIVDINQQRLKEKRRSCALSAILRSI